MNPPTSTALTHKSSVELFNIRIKTRLCVAVLCMLQIIPRTLLVIQAFASNSPQPAKILLLDIPFAPMMGVIIGIEYLLFKKKGSRILRYSHLVDILLLLLFMTDWLFILIDALINHLGTEYISIDIVKISIFELKKSDDSLEIKGESY